MRTYYIYKSTNTINGKSYIGKTVNYKARVLQHLRCYEREDCVFHREIERVGKENFSWEIIEEVTDEKEADRLERKYIQEYNSYIPNGYNQNKGGVGGHNARAIICLTLDGAFVKRYDSASDAEKEGFNNVNVLLCCKGELHSCKGHVFMFEDDYKEHGAKKYKKPIPHNTTKVIQCDLEGNMIKKFSSVSEASKQTGVRRSIISLAITGRYKTAGGFIFVYEKDFPIKDLKKHQKRKKGRKIAQVDADTGEIIKVFDRISDAGKELGVNYKAIHKVVDLPNRKAYGYKWISQ